MTTVYHRSRWSGGLGPAHYRHRGQPRNALPTSHGPQSRGLLRPESCLILDGGTTPGGQPSTLVRVRGEQVEILRQGAVGLVDWA
jgi:tRNA A37 threonylcarbamoyladenosine synthetase subunit TsaC/SUA5/YrdC